ncbi:MAG: amidohydrolase family protein [Alphaproteobacteria bacterium]
MTAADTPSGTSPDAYPFGRVRPPDEAFLARQAPEAPIEPDLPIVDTHHHLWDRRTAGRRGGEPPIGRYLLDELMADIRSGHNVVQTVFLECHSMYRAGGPVEMRPVGEVEFVAGVAAMSESGAYGPERVAAGIVGFADLALGDRVAPVLEAQIAAGGGRFRGVRFSAAWDADPVIGNSHGVAGLGLYREPAVIEGVRRLAAHGLSLDAWCFHPQLADVAALARAVPEATIVLNHVGGPLAYGRYAGRAEEVHAAWKPAMAEIAACPNVFVKLGGQVMRLGAFPYPTAGAPPSSEAMAAHWRPWVGTCIELFGAGRCMFESNFPVDRMGTGWVPLWNAFKRIAADASAGEKAALFAGTARRAYRLETP